MISNLRVPEPANGRRDAGFVLPLLLFAALGLVFFLGFVSNMGSQYANQVAHLDETTRVRAIGDSVYAQVLARIRAKPWKERFFAARPFVEEDVGFLDGSYDLLVRDAKGSKPEDCLVDVFVQAHFGRVSRLFYWRFRQEFSILDAGGKAFPILFANLSSATVPIQDAGESFDSQIRTIIKEREENRAAVQQMGSMLQTTVSLPNVLNVVNVKAEAPVEEPRPDGPQISVSRPPPPSVPPVPPTSKNWSFPKHEKTDAVQVPPGGTFSPISSNGTSGGIYSPPPSSANAPYDSFSFPPGWDEGSGVSVPDDSGYEQAYVTPTSEEEPASGDTGEYSDAGSTDSGAGYDSGYDYDPAGDPGYDPAGDPGYDPAGDPGYDPAGDPGYDPGYDPGTDPGYDPGKDPGYKTGEPPAGEDPGYDGGYDSGADSSGMDSGGDYSGE